MSFSYRLKGYLLSRLFLLFLVCFLVGFLPPHIWFCAFIFLLSVFLLITDKMLLTQNSSPMIPTSVASSRCPVPAVKVETRASFRFLIRSKSQLPVGSLVKVSSAPSPPFPRERWMAISPAHPTLFQLSFALSVKSWHPGDGRTCSEFSPGEPRINITWLFLPTSCSLSAADVSDTRAILCHDPSSLGPANLYRVGWPSTASRQSSEGRGMEDGQGQAWDMGRRFGLLQLWAKRRKRKWSLLLRSMMPNAKTY